MSWKDYINPYTVLGGVGGAYAGHAKFGKKHGYTAPIVGGVVGILAGVLVEKLVAPRQATPQVAAPQPQPQVQQAPAGQGEYIDLDGLGEYVQPPPPNASPTQRAEYEAAQAAYENLGSLSGADGLGSLSGTPGFDADAIDYDEVLGEGGGGDFN